MIQIRDIASANRAWLLALNNRATPDVNHLELDDLDELLAMACYARLAVIGDEPRGALLALWPGSDYVSANYRWFSQRFRGFLYVDRVIVADGARGQGVGQALYADLERFALGRASSIALEVNSLPPNPVSMRFHEAAGFDAVGEQEHDPGEHDAGARKVVMMMKSLIEGQVRAEG